MVMGDLQIKTSQVLPCLLQTATSFLMYCLV